MSSTLIETLRARLARQVRGVDRNMCEPLDVWEQVLALASAPVAGGTCGTCKHHNDCPIENVVQHRDPRQPFGCTLHVPASPRTSEPPR